MICRRCGADVAPTKFCAKCGALLNGKRCNTCGAIMGVNEGYCAECGTPAPNQAPPPGYGYGGNGHPNNYGGQPYQGQQATSLKKRTKHAPAPTENKHVVLRGFLGGLGALAALAVMVYFYLFGDLISLNVNGTAQVISPLLFSSSTFTYSIVPGSWSLIGSFEEIIAYFTAFGDNIGGVFGNELSMTVFLASLPGLIFQLAYFISALLLALAVIIGVIKFLVCLLSKKEFDLMLPLELGLIAYLSMFISLLMIGGYDIIAYGSGLMIGLYAGAAALIWQILLNVGLAGKRFFKGGSIMKWITNLGFFAGAAIMLFAVPVTVNYGGADVSPISWFALSIYSLTQGGTVDIAILVYMGIMAVSMIGFVWSLASVAAKAGKRAARTFKFDGYADKGCIRKGFAALIAAVTFAVFAGLATETAPTAMTMFIVGGALMFVFAILNRIFLNKDQLS